MSAVAQRAKAEAVTRHLAACTGGLRPSGRALREPIGFNPFLCALQRLVYSTFAETFLAGGRIEFVARFCWLLDLLKPRAITGGANNFGQWLARLFHNDQSLK